MGFNDCIYIDADTVNKQILLLDYTHRQILKQSYILKNQFQNKWALLENNCFLIDGLNVYYIKEVIIKRLDKFKIKYILSPTILYF